MRNSRPRTTFSAVGDRRAHCQISRKITNTSGTATRLRKNASSQSLINGASHRPTRNPSTTEGTAAIISMAGLIQARTRGVVKWLT